MAPNLIERSYPSQKINGALNVYQYSDDVFTFEQEVFRIGQINDEHFKIYGRQVITTIVRADSIEEARRNYDKVAV